MADRRWQWCFVVSCICIYQSRSVLAQALRQVAMVNLAEQDHVHSMFHLAAELVRRNVSVVMFISSPHIETVTRLRDDHIPDEARERLTFIMYAGEDLDHKPSDDWMLHRRLRHRTERRLMDCRALLDSPGAQDVLAGSQIDLVVGDALSPCSWLIADAMNCPRVDLLTADSLATSELILYRLSFPLAYTAGFDLGYTSGKLLPFHHRFLQLVWHVAYLAHVEHIAEPLIESFRQQHNSTLPSLSDSRQRSVLTLVEADWPLTAPRPVSPQLKYVGLLEHPLAPNTPFLFPTHSGHFGPVLVQLGRHCPPDIQKLVWQALEQLQQPVLWIMPEGQSDTPWGSVDGAAWNTTSRLVLYQVDMARALCFSNISLLITEARARPVNQAVYCSTPVFAIPMTPDQCDEAASADWLGIGRSMTPSSLRRAGPMAVKAAISDTLSSGPIRQQVATLARRSRAHPHPPVQQAVDWIQYAFNAGPEPFLAPAEVALSWWQLSLLDLPGTAMFAVLVIFLTVQMAVLMWHATVADVRAQIAAEREQRQAQIEEERAKMD